MGAQPGAALLRRALVAALGLLARRVLHGMRLVEDDDAIEVAAQPLDDLLHARRFRLALGGATFSHLPRVLAGWRLYPGIKSYARRLEMHVEVNRMMLERLGHVPDQWIYNYAHARLELTSIDASQHLRFALGLATLTVWASLRWNHALPATIAEVMLGQYATPETVAALEAKLGLTRPLVIRRKSVGHRADRGVAARHRRAPVPARCAAAGFGTAAAGRHSQAGPCLAMVPANIVLGRRTRQRSA